MRIIAETLVSKFAIQGINAGTGIITARALMPAGRGQLAAMILWPSILASFTALGVPSSLIYFFRLSMTGRSPEQRERIVATGLVMSVLTGILATIIGVIFIPHWMKQYSPETIRAAQWFMIVTPVTAVTLAGKSILEAAGSFSSSNLLQLSTPLFTAVPLVVLWAVHRLDPFTAACTYIFAALPSFVYLLYRLKPLVTHLRGDVASAKLLLGYGVRSYGTDLLGTLALQVDQVLVVRFLTPTAMGSYVVMLSLSRMLNLVYNSVTMILFPKAAGLTAEAVLALTERCARVATIVSAAAAIFVYIFGPFFINLLYGREYGSALSSLRILLIEVTLAGTAYVLAQAFMALGRPGVLTILQAIGLSISIPLMILLIPRWGIKGAAFALLASTLARLVFLMAAFPIFLKTRMPNLLPQAEDFELLWSRLPFGRKLKAA
jgi:O-antigen/teichoic acid export membrane protein